MFSHKVVNFKDFSRPNKEIKYFSRTLTKFKDFSRQLLKFIVKENKCIINLRYSLYPSNSLEMYKA